MSFEYLKSTDPPWIHIEEVDNEERSEIPSAKYCADTNSCILRVIRGSVARSTEQLINEVSAAFQMPYRTAPVNWYGVKDGFQYLDEWLPARRYVVYISDAPLLLSDEPEAWRWLLLTLHEVGSYWSQSISDNGRLNRPPVPFHTLLTYEYGSLTQLLHLVRAGLADQQKVRVSGLI